MNHYQVLGVEADADSAQIRKAYLKLARINHPDFAEASGEQMRLINAAWHVLSDTDRRLDYDRRLRSLSTNGPSEVPNGTTFSSSSPAGRGTSRIERPSSEFTPYFTSDEDDDDSWRYEPDPVNPDTVPPKSLLAAPAAAFVGGIALLAVSAPTGSRALVAAGIILLVIAGLLFVGAPVVALFKSQVAEQRSASGRSTGATRGSPKASSHRKPKASPRRSNRNAQGKPDHGKSPGRY